MTACLYLHGFLSSPQSQKAQQLLAFYQQHRPADELRIPTLPFAPQAAMKVAQQTLQQLQLQHEQIYLIGSSLGGFYATYLAEQYQLPVVLINPAVRPFELFADYLGPHQHFYDGKTYVLEMQHVEQLRQFEVTQLTRPQDILLLLQTADETLDYRLAAEKYCHSVGWLEGGGNHSFERFIERMPTVLEFVRQRCASQ